MSKICPSTQRTDVFIVRTVLHWTRLDNLFFHSSNGRIQLSEIESHFTSICKQIWKDIQTPSVHIRLWKKFAGPAAFTRAAICSSFSECWRRTKDGWIGTVLHTCEDSKRTRLCCSHRTGHNPAVFLDCLIRLLNRTLDLDLINFYFDIGP